MSPPIDFGTAWRCVGVHRRYGNELALWLCDEPPAAYSDAYKRARASMTAAGFSWTDRGHDQPRLLACWWDLGVTVDVDALRAEVDRVVAEAAAECEQKAAAEQKRHERDVAETELRALLIRSALRALLQERPWALGRALSEARDLAAEEAWTSWGLRSAERYLSNAEDNIRRAEERLSRTPPALWFARAADEAVRGAALEACRELSARDEDWAADRNSIGWSQATCWAGHVLSEREALDHGETAHALALLHQHRRQLSDELNLALFGEAPARRRRPAPAEPAGALLL
ncbi:hypothetical protein [Methylorubrum extorquens]|uniref:Uncharacterized protein n=1 Tax=Methylorubrum extorquens (strain ATCC 14718 / DSM 1338 / JCM 2805 / NCIMB 9133 / AM1) TaxID=272630 RepID=C5B075_METEA|nr:hypothetical protein [Methylorubrum extorquens]ACS39425.1 Hypothetical protein MexAM1_META1p1563 [Methylorubrum extorquens AM1]MCP1542469.1 hypothetical protein [Methylorubrum extorquens]MCP1590186.1 hypothetical protein [Methylorubrum extorquens]